jgi:hypothetical protein
MTAARTVGVIAILVFAGCTLDWTERPDPGLDAGVMTGPGLKPADSGPATTDDDDDVIDAPDAEADATAPVDCSALAADAAEKKKKAQACSFQVGECSTTVNDECGCEVAIGKTGGAATTTYEAAVAKLAAHPECLSCKTCPGHVAGSCLQKPSTEITCTP